MTTLGELLRKLSFVDEDFLQKNCSERSKQIHTYIGTTILMTGIFAVISSAVALSWIIESNILIALVSIFWGVVIIVFDRGIIVSNTRWIILLRTALAIVVALLISVPLELLIMEGKIDAELQTKLDANESQIHQELLDLEESYKLEISPLEEKLNYHNDQSLKFQRKMDDELSSYDPDKQTYIKSGQGERYKANERVRDEHESKKESYRAQIQNRETKYQESKERILNKPKPIDVRDLLARYSALETLKNKHDEKGKLTVEAKSTRGMSLLLRLLFVIIELSPALLKLTLPKTDYQSYSDFVDRKTQLITYKMDKDLQKRLVAMESAEFDEKQSFVKYVKKLLFENKI